MSQPYKPETALTEAAPAPTAERKQHCAHQAECMKMIQLVLDGEASTEQIEQISQNIGKCMPCEHGYQLEKNIKEALQLRLAKKIVPTSLLDSIRNRVATL